MSLWLVGAGSIAMEYSKVLDSLNVSYEVIGRSRDSARKFEAVIGRSVYVGGLDSAILKLHPPKSAIVAVSVKDLASVTSKLIAAGVPRILVEKPGGISSEEIQEVASLAFRLKSNVYVAYNRRFYSSTKLARELINRDGGALSFFFDFTELSKQIELLDIDEEVKANWLVANSSHVIDLAFHLCGDPKKIIAEHAGSLDWHPKSSVFGGVGVTSSEVFFSYHANWESPGRWGLEIMTRNTRIIFRPFERLQIVKEGSFQIEEVVFNDELDKKYKPGFFCQTKAFIEGDDSFLCSIAEQSERFKIYNVIAGYD